MPINKSYLYISLIFILVLAALSPFFRSGIILDYDSLAATCSGYLMEDQRTYKPSRMPGSPSYELTLVAVCKLASTLGASTNQLKYWAQTFSTILGLALLALLFLDLRKELSSSNAALATLVFGLHHLFLWFAWAAAEDLPALFFGYFGFWIIRRREDLWPWAALSLAMATTSKFIAIAYFAASMVWVFSNFSRKTFFQFVAFTSCLAFLFALPALIYFKMSPALAFGFVDNDTDPAVRPAIGWDLIKYSVYWYVPALVALFFQYTKKAIRTFRKGERFMLESGADPLLFALCTASFFNLYKFGGLFLYLTVAGILFWLWQAYCSRRISIIADLRIHWALIIGLVTLVLFQAPYSRSYFLLAFPPLLLLLAKRFKSNLFWASMLILAYLPMFHYLEFRKPIPFIHLHASGFYQAHFNGKDSDYNHGRFESVPLLFGTPREN